MQAVHPSGSRVSEVVLTRVCLCATVREYKIRTRFESAFSINQGSQRSPRVTACFVTSRECPSRVECCARRRAESLRTRYESPSFIFHVARAMPLAQSTQTAPDATPTQDSSISAISPKITRKSAEKSFFSPQKRRQTPRIRRLDARLSLSATRAADIGSVVVPATPRTSDVQHDGWWGVE